MFLVCLSLAFCWFLSWVYRASDNEAWCFVSLGNDGDIKEHFWYTSMKKVRTFIVLFFCSGIGNPLMSLRIIKLRQKNLLCHGCKFCGTHTTPCVRSQVICFFSLGNASTLSYQQNFPLWHVKESGLTPTSVVTYCTTSIVNHTTYSEKNLSFGCHIIFYGLKKKFCQIGYLCVIPRHFYESWLLLPQYVWEVGQKQTFVMVSVFH